MTQIVLATDIGWSDVSTEAAVLADADVVLADRTDPGRLAALAADASAILTCFARVPGEVLRAAPHCLTVARYGVGVDNIDVETATELGIVVTNVTSYCADEVADHSLALLLALSRGVRGNGAVPAGAVRRRLRGRVLGIVGFGETGAALAVRALALGMSVIALARRDPAVAGVSRADDLDDLLRRSDVVSLHLPLDDATRGIIGARELALMKHDAVLINTARGGLVDTDALTDALGRGRLGGAGLDVTVPEPLPADHPLRAMGNVVITDHIAYSSDGSLHELTTRAAQNVRDVLAGIVPDSVVNPEVLTLPELRMRTVGRR